MSLHHAAFPNLRARILRAASACSLLCDSLPVYFMTLPQDAPTLKPETGAPAKSATPSRTRVPPKKTASKVAAGSSAAKRTALKIPRPKAIRSRTAPRKTPLLSKASSQTENQPAGTTESSASAE